MKSVPTQFAEELRRRGFVVDTSAQNKWTVTSADGFATYFCYDQDDVIKILSNTHAYKSTSQQATAQAQDTTPSGLPLGTADLNGHNDLLTEQIAAIRNQQIRPVTKRLTEDVELLKLRNEELRLQRDNRRMEIEKASLDLATKHRRLLIAAGILLTFFVFLLLAK